MTVEPFQPYEPLLVDTSDDGAERVHVQLAGELDLATAPSATARLLEIVRTANGLVVVDLERLTFCDSTGACMFVEVQKAAERRPVRLVLRNPTREVRRVFEITALDRVIVIEPAITRARRQPSFA